MSDFDTQLNIENTGWTSFFGTITIILGVLYSIFIVGAVIGVPLIFIGLKLRNASKYANELRSNKDIFTATNSINEFLKAFKIYGVIIVVGFSIWLLSMIGIIVYTAVTEGF